MKAPANQREANGIKLHDIIYVLFKHRWKIVLLSMAGFGAAAAIAYKESQTPSYETHAGLLVRYVVDRVMDPEAEENPGVGGSAIGTELAILRSSDLALDVAEKLGPEALLPDEEGERTLERAAGRVLRGFEASSERGSNVLNLSYRDSSPELAVEILNQVIDSYFWKHLEIHRSTEAFEEVERQAEQARLSLARTEEQINRLKAESGVLSVEATVVEFEIRRQAIRESLMASRAALAEQQAKVAALEKPSNRDVSGAGGASDDPESAGSVADLADEEGGVHARRENAAAIYEHRDLVERLSLLRQQRNEILIRRKPSDPMVLSLDQQIEKLQSRGLDLIERHPELADLGFEQNAEAPPQMMTSSLKTERALAAALEAKVEVIAKQVEAIDGEVEQLSSLGFRLQELDRRREMEEEKYRYFQSSLEKARIDETLDPSKIPNISVVQSPTAPRKSIDEDTKKIVMGLAASGLVVGLGLAFLLEWVIDQRVSRPMEIQTRLQLPLMMSIPYVRSASRAIGTTARQPSLGLLERTADEVIPAVNGTHLPGDSEHFITPYTESIRDRIMFNFEINNITRKPKLVALAGLSKGAGASTIAAGLAKAFAESGDRKVLLVDLNPVPGNGSAEPHPSNPLLEAVNFSKSERFRSGPRKLYFANAPTHRRGSACNALGPARLHEMLPNLSTSGFDYIIFDMPLMGPTSPTLAMAGFMDKVLLVLEAEKTTREDLKWGFTELEKVRADVSCIFNKARNHAPRWVQGEM